MQGEEEGVDLGPELPAGVPIISHGGGAPMPVMTEADLDRAMVLAEKSVALHDRMRRLALSSTEPCDWVDEGGKPYLQWSGSSKVALAFGVSYQVQKFDKEAVEDDRGKYVMYHCTGIISFRGQGMSEIGSASTRDPFFCAGKKWDEASHSYSKYDKPLSEIDLSDVRKKAMTNFLGRALKSKIGLSFSWETIESFTGGRINRNNCGGKFEYKKPQAGTGGGQSGGGQSGGRAAITPESRAKREDIWAKLLALNGGSEEATRANLATRTAYVWEGKQMAGKQDIMMVSEKGIGYLDKDVSAEYAELLERAKG